MMIKLWRVREIIREWLISIQRVYYLYYGYDISKTAKISLGAKLDKAAPQRIHIGDESYVASGARILGHDYCRAKGVDTRIGKRCFIGADSLVLPGVELKDSTIVAAGAVVTKSPGVGGVILAGNPAKIIKENVQTKKYGMIIVRTMD